MRDLVKGVGKTSGATLFSFLFFALTVKVIAVLNGPAGVGLFSVLKQLRDTTLLVGTGGGQTAVVQGLSHFQDDARAKYLVMTFWFFIAGASVAGILLLLAAPFLSYVLFGAELLHGVSLIRWMTIPIVLIILHCYFLAILNAHGALGHLALSQIIGAIVSLLVAYPVAYGVSNGYASAYVILFALPVLFSFIYVVSVVFHLYKPQWRLQKENSVKLKKLFKHFFKMAGGTLFTSLLYTATLLVIKVMVFQHLGMTQAGIFDAAWMFSMTYLGLLLASFGTYYLPKLSAIKNNQERQMFITQVLRFSLLAGILLITTAIVFKPLYIYLFYSSDFLSSLDIIRWMIVGDYFKMISWIFAMTMLAYADMRVYCWVEVFSSLGLLVGSYWIIFQLNAMVYFGALFLIICLVYMLLTIAYVYHRGYFRFSKKDFLHMLLGLGLIIVTSTVTWDTKEMVAYSHLLFIGIAVGLSWSMLTYAEKQRCKNSCKKIISFNFNEERT